MTTTSNSRKPLYLIAALIVLAIITIIAIRHPKPLPANQRASQQTTIPLHQLQTSTAANSNATTTATEVSENNSSVNPAANTANTEQQALAAQPQTANTPMPAASEMDVDTSKGVLVQNSPSS